MPSHQSAQEVSDAFSSSPSGMPSRNLFVEPQVLLKVSRNQGQVLSEGICSGHCPSVSLMNHEAAAIVGYQVSTLEQGAFEDRFGVLPPGHIVLAVPQSILRQVSEVVDAQLAERVLDIGEDRFLISGMRLSQDLRNFVESTGEVSIYHDEEAIELPRGLGTARSLDDVSHAAAALSD